MFFFPLLLFLTTQAELVGLRLYEILFGFFPEKKKKEKKAPCYIFGGASFWTRSGDRDIYLLLATHSLPLCSIFKSMKGKGCKDHLLSAIPNL